MKKDLEEKYRQCIANIKKCVRMSNSTKDQNLRTFWLRAEQGFIERALQYEASK